MRICFPVKEDKGLESTVYNHFGSAPIFIIFDSELKKTYAVNNGDMKHAHGACSPIKAIGDQHIDAVVVGGIGAGAIRGLNASGIKVYKALKDRVVENIDLMMEDSLPELSIQHACTIHQGGCGH